MKRRGQIDQIVTSIIIVIAAVFISGVFISISSNVAQISGVSNKPLTSNFDFSLKDGTSKAVLDSFLSDEVTVKGNSLQVIQAIGKFDGAKDEALEYASAVENLFIEKYSCSGENVLVISKSKGYSTHSPKTDFYDTGVRKYSYIDYPSHLVSSDSFGAVKSISDSANEVDSSSFSVVPSGFGAGLAFSDFNVAVYSRGVSCGR